MQKIINVTELYENYPFLKQSEQAIQQIVDREKIKFETDQTKDFSFVNANLSNFFPEIAESVMEDVYMNIHLNRTLMLVESRNEGAADYLKAENGEVLHDKQPKIFCTYHLGPYRAPIALLIKENVDFVLLLDDATVRSQEAYILQQVASLKQQYSSTSRVELLNVERDNVIYKVINYTKQGMSILAYIDGNTGGRGVYHRDDKFQTTVDFLKHKIQARSGLAAIAYLTKLPIYPIITFRPKKKNVPPTIIIEPPVLPTRDVPLKEFAHSATRTLYGVLEKYMADYFDQWEPWFYIHKYVLQEALLNQPEAPAYETDKNGQLTFNRKQFCLFKMDQDCYLLDKQKYLTYPIPEELFTTLKKVEERATTSLVVGTLRRLKGLRFLSRRPRIDTALLSELQKKNILVYA